jgi:N-acetylglutamate synthase-like GNAT family acetyltransferase
VDNTSLFRLVPFEAKLADTFRQINEEWIVAMFHMEDSDKALLNEPESAIINCHGHIWFVEHQSLGIIGTCALVQRSAGVFELTKMGVLESARGLDAGKFLLDAVLKQAVALKIETLFLLTSSKCEAAIHLYRQRGFVDDAEIMDTFAMSYKRCDVAMRWTGYDS